MSIQRRIYEQNLGVNEAVKVGDTVHIGHGTKGGTGVTGKVTKVSGGMVHIQNDRGDTFKGPVNRVTVKEAVKPAMRAGIDYKPATPSDAQKKIMKREADKVAKMRSTPDTSAAGRAAQRMIDARKATQAGLRMKQQNQESVELEEGPAHQNPRVTAFGGMQAAQNTPSFQRYQERLKKEREERARKAADKSPEPKSKELPKSMRNEANLTPSQERDAQRRLKPTRATVAKVRLPATDDQVAANVKKWQSEKGGNPGNTKKRRIRDLRLRKEEVQTDEAIKYDAAHPESGITGKVTGKGKRDRGPGGEVKVQYTGHPAYGDKGGKLPIKARDIGRLLKTARKPGTTAYHSRNVRNPRLTKDHVELEGLDLSEMNYLGKDKKFGREFYEKDGQLHVKKPGGTYVQNLGSVSVPANKKMMKGLVKDSNESVELDEVSPPGFEGTVKAMKKRHKDKIDNPWALAWWMKNKGYKSHKKPDGSPKEGE